MRMLSPVSLDTLRIDTGKPLVIVDVDTVSGADQKIFFTIKDMQILKKYFEYAEELLEAKER